MDYEELKKANAEISTTNIKGKEYAEVSERVKAFRKVYPTGFITTQLLSVENGVCMFKAVAGYTVNGEVHELGTGHAYEKENDGYINKTSFIENCETSAVGRALGFAGFGIDVSIASAEEVKQAQEVRKATPEQVKQLKALLTEDRQKKLCEVEKIDKIEDLSLTKASNIISKLQKEQEKNGVNKTN